MERAKGKGGKERIDVDERRGEETINKYNQAPPPDPPPPGVPASGR